MVKVIIGLKGSGKTKQLISLVNEAAKADGGSVICIERGDKLIYDISHDVRLIDSSQEEFRGYQGLVGFICGLHAGNYDITHIFIDSLYKVAESEDPDEAESFLDWLDDYGKKYGIRFTVTISTDIRSASSGVMKYLQA
jgi:hypothetical protein